LEGCIDGGGGDTAVFVVMSIVLVCIYRFGGEAVMVPCKVQGIIEGKHVQVVVLCDYKEPCVGQELIHTSQPTWQAGIWHDAYAAAAMFPNNATLSGVAKRHGDNCHVLSVHATADLAYDKLVAVNSEVDKIAFISLVGVCFISVFFYIGMGIALLVSMYKLRCSRKELLFVDFALRALQANQPTDAGKQRSDLDKTV
jgi:hypothetical protein